MKFTTRTLRITLWLLCLFSISVYGEKLYRWVDDNGRVHYTDKPPAERVEKQAEVSESLKPLNIGENSDEINKIKDVFPQETEEEANFRQQQAEEKKKQRQQQLSKCDKARRDLKTIRGRVVFFKDGKAVDVTEGERKQMAADLEKLIRRHCS